MVSQQTDEPTAGSEAPDAFSEAAQANVRVEELEASAPPAPEQPQEEVSEGAPPAEEAAPEETNAEPAFDEETQRKVENDRRAREGRERARERDTLLTTMAQSVQASDLRLETLEKQLDRIAGKLMRGEDDESFAADIEAIRGETQQARAQRQWDATYQSYVSDLHDILDGDDGNPVLNINGPELAEAKERWNNGRRDQNPTEMQAALRLVTQARIVYERQAAQQAAEAAKPAPRPRGQDMTTTPSSTSRGVSVTMENIDRLMATIGDHPPAVQQEIRNKYRLLMRDGAF